MIGVLLIEVYVPNGNYNELIGLALFDSSFFFPFSLGFSPWYTVIVSLHVMCIYNKPLFYRNIFVVTLIFPCGNILGKI